MANKEPLNHNSIIRAPFNLTWVDLTLENYNKGPFVRTLESDLSAEQSPIAPMTMELAAELTMAEIEADPLNFRLHKILSEAGKFCVDDYEKRQALKAKQAVRLNWLTGNTGS
jgi:hypothetical protein